MELSNGLDEIQISEKNQQEISRSDQLYSPTRANGQYTTSSVTDVPSEDTPSNNTASARFVQTRSGHTVNDLERHMYQVKNIDSGGFSEIDLTNTNGHVNHGVNSEHKNCVTKPEFHNGNVPLSNEEFPCSSVCNSEDGDNGSSEKPTKKVVRRPKVTIDGGWSWVILLTSTVVFFLNFGLQDSYGVIFPKMVERFDVPLSTVSWIGSIGVGFGCVAALFIPSLMDRIGCFWTGIIGVFLVVCGYISSMFITSVYPLYLTMGAIPALGWISTFLAYMRIISHCFHKKRPMAMGLAYSGAGLGAVVLPPLINFLLETYSLWGTLLLIGGIVLNQLWCHMTFFSLEPSNSEKVEDETKVGVREFFRLLRSKEMILVLLFSMFQAMVYNCFPTYIPTTSVKQIEGMTSNQASLIISIYGGFSTCGRVVIGIFLTYLKSNGIRVFIVLTCCCAISIATVPLCMSFAALAANSAIYAFLIGAIVAVQPTMLVDIFGTRVFTHAYGMFLSAGGMAAIVGIPLAGWVAEISGDDRTIFYMAAAGFSLAALSLVPLSMGKSAVYSVELDVKAERKMSEPRKMSVVEISRVELKG